MTARALIAALIVTVGLPPAVTLAQRSRVKQLLKQAAKEYRLGNFKESLDAYRQALAIESRPSTILNIAQCHRQLGERERALFYYKLYLTEWDRANPDKPAMYLEEVQGFIKQLQEEVEREKRAAASPPAHRSEVKKEKPAPPQPPPKRAVTHAALPATVPASAVAATEPPPPRSQPFYKRWWFWTGVGVVIAGAATTGVLAARRGSESSLPHYTPDNFGN